MVPKSYSYAQSRRSGKPPSDEGGGFAEGEDGGREIKKEKFSPPVPLPRDSPLVRGGLGCAHSRISGGEAEYAKRKIIL